MFVAGDSEAGPQITGWLASCRESLRAYFALEDPRRLEPAERELYVETLLDSKLLLRGFVDRIDVAPERRLSGSWMTRPAAPPVSGSRARPCSRCGSTRLSSGAPGAWSRHCSGSFYLGDGQMVS